MSKLTTSGSHPGKYLAVGDQDGTVTLLELCESLYMPQSKEKDVINEMFERETRKEKTLDLIKRQADTKKGPKEPKGAKDFETKKAEAIKKVEDEFFAHIGKNEGDALQEGEERQEQRSEREGQEEGKNEDEIERKSEPRIEGTSARDIQGGEDRQGSPEADKKSDHNLSQEKSGAEQKGEPEQSQQQEGDKPEQQGEQSQEKSGDQQDAPKDQE